MKAVVLKEPKVLKVEDVPIPVADNDYMLIEVKACGICGSDIRYYNGENPWALHTLGKNIPNPPNIILGHECAGVVHEVKNKQYQHFLGKRVALMAFHTCGVCDNCRNGNYHLCENTQHIGHGAGWGKRDYYPGGMAEYCPIWNTHVCEIPETMSFEEATLLDPISVAIHAISLSGIKPGDDVLVLGTGAVGISIAQAVRAYGASKVICTDVYEAALSLAKELGIDEAVDVRSENIKDALKKQGLESVKIVFDTVGTEESQQTSLKILKQGGTLVNLVANMTKSTFKLTDLAGERRIIASANNRTEDFLQGIKLVENGIIQAKKMITHVIPLSEVQKGFDTMLYKEKNRVMKVVIKP